MLGPLGRQIRVLDAVIDGRADVAPVDSYALDLLRRDGSARAARVRVVATSVAAPSAPVVASAIVDDASRERLTDALLTAHDARELSETLAALLLSRFVRVRATELEVFLERQREAEARGYPRLA